MTRHITTLNAILAFVALLPGVFIVLRLVTFPNTESELMGAVSSLGGVVLVAALLLVRARIAGMKQAHVALTSLMLLLAGTGTLVVYTGFIRPHVVEFVGPRDTPNEPTQVIVPMAPSEDLRQLVSPASESTRDRDYARALLNPLIDDEVRGLIEEENDVTLAFAVILMLFGQSLLLAAVVISIIRLAPSFGNNAEN